MDFGTTIIVVFIAIVLIIVILILKKVFSSSQIEHAAKLMDNGNYSDAIKILKSLINKNDLNSKAHFLLGECYLRQENFEWAMPEYKNVLKISKYSEGFSEAKVRERLADIFLHYNMLEEAQKEFLLISQLQPNNYQIYYRIGKIFKDRNYLTNAYSYLKKAISINPKHLDSLFLAGEISYDQKRYSDALEELQLVLRIEPEYYKAHYYLGMVHMINQNYNFAIPEFDFAIKDPEFKLVALSQKGRALFESRNIEKAIIELERAIRLIKTENVTSLSIRYYLALCYEQTRELDKAIELWETVAKIKPNFMDVQEKLNNYQELRTDDKIKDFLIASSEDFERTCKEVLGFLGLEIVEIENNKGIKLDIIASEAESKWRNTRRMKRVVKILRSNDVIGDSIVREVLEMIKKIGATKGMIITSSKFSHQAVNFAQTRPIDLIDKDGLSKLLKRVEKSKTEQQNNESKV